MNRRDSRVDPRRLSAVTLGFAATILLVIVGLSYREWQHYSSLNADADRTAKTHASVDRLLADLMDAEAGQRGFLLTGEDSYLEPYNRAVQAIPGELAMLRSDLSAYPAEAARLSDLSTQEMAELRQTVDVRRSRGSAPAVAEVLSGQGTRTMDAIRALSAEIGSREKDRQRKASVEGEAAAQAALLTTSVASLVLLLLLAVLLGLPVTIETRDRGRSLPVRYGAAVLAVAAAVLLRRALTPLIGPTELGFSVSLPAVLFAAWFGGLGPGALSVLLSGIASNYYFLEPVGSVLIRNEGDQVSLLIFAVLGFGIVFLGDSQRRAVERALRAEDAERIERQRFQTTLASIGDAVVATGTDGRVTFANGVALSLMRWTEAEIAGKPLDDAFRIVNEFTRQAVESPVAKVLREGSIVGLANHTILIARDGTEVPIDDSAAPIRSGDGANQGTVLVFRDITERRRAESAIRFLASIVESSDDAIISLDLNGIVTTWNHGAERMFGYSAEEMIGRPVSLLTPPERTDELPVIRERIRHGEHYQTIRRTNSGKPLHVSISVSPLRDRSGEVTGASKIVRDITALVEAQAEIAGQRERLRVTLNCIGDAVMSTDTAGRVSYLNPVAERLTGWTSEDALGRPLEEVFRMINEESREVVDNPVVTVLREGRIVGLTNHTLLISREGKELAIDDSAAPIRDARGQIIGVVLVFRDVSAKRAAEEQLRSRAEELRALIDATPALVWFAHDPQCRLITGNDAANQLLGVPPGTKYFSDARRRTGHPDPALHPPGPRDPATRAADSKSHRLRPGRRRRRSGNSLER